MDVSNLLLIHAPVRRIYELAARVERWSELLPHYRWVRVLEEHGNRRVVEMACRRGVIPLRWTATQELFPDLPRIRFRHVAGITRGMEVAWDFRATPVGVEVRIDHQLTLRWPLIERPAADHIIGPLFVQYVAGKTLARLKELAESAEGAQL